MACHPFKVNKLQSILEKMIRSTFGKADSSKNKWRQQSIDLEMSKYLTMSFNIV